MKKNLIILLLSLFFALKIDAQCDGVPYFNYWNTTNNMSFYPHVTEPYYLVETNWAFSDGQNMNQTSSYHVITSFSETGTHEVCVTYTIASSVDENYFCVTTICESFEVNCISLDVDLTSTIDPVDGTFEVTANVMNGVAPYSFQWWVWPGTILTTNDNTIFCDFEDHSYAQVNCSVIEQNGSLGCGSQYATITALNPQVDCEISLTATVMENVVSVEATMMDGEYSPTYPYIYFDFGDGSVPVAAEVGWTSPDVTHAYPVIGSYQICGISEAGFEDSCPDTSCIFVNVESIDLDCQAAFNESVSSGNYISITNASTGYYTDMEWNVDGTIVTNQDYYWNSVTSWPVTATLTISNDSTGCTSSVTETIDLNDYTFYVCGTMYWDANNNNVIDDSEAGLAFQNIEITDQNNNVMIVQTASDGTYCVELNLANGYTLFPQNSDYPNANYYPSYFSTYGGWNGGTNYVNFGTYYVIGEPDVNVNCQTSYVISAVSGTWLIVTVSNDSDQIVSGNLEINSGSFESFVGTPDMEGVFSNENSTFTATLTLQPFEQDGVLLYVQLDPTAPLNYSQFITASFELTSGEDANADDNSCISQQIVVGSFDPNDKQVSPQGNGPQGSIEPSTDWLTYRINFQNTGTAPAHDVRIEDEISNHLDMSSLEVIATSHTCFTTMVDQHVKFEFNNIMLPDSSANEPESHGFVVYRIRVLPNLPDQTQINNTAAIYFDFNEPIITNTTVNTIDYLINSVGTNSALQVSAFPNPASDELNVSVDMPATLRVFDMTGSLVVEKNLKTGLNRIEMHSFADGLYTFILNTNSDSNTFKIMKR
jgi:hypothetical protein